jgi:hypothetical protein
VARAWRIPLAFAAVLITSAGCVRTDPGDACTTLGDCPAGTYCRSGSCRSDCSADADCGSQHMCTPSGQCLRTDVLTCEEGEDPAPAAILRVLPADDPFLVDSVECGDGQLTLGVDQQENLPLGLDTSSTNDACLAVLDVKYLVADVFLGEVASCRPTLLSGDQVLWHVLPLLLTPIDTTMMARLGPDHIDFIVGHSSPDAVGPPLPGESWVTATAAVDGSRLEALADGQAFTAVARRVLGDDNVTPANVRAHLVRHQQDSRTWVEVDGQVFQDGGGLLGVPVATVERIEGGVRVRYQDPQRAPEQLGHDPLVVQLAPDNWGRLDGMRGDAMVSLCWSYVLSPSP